jgi:hypothetical protein
MPFDLSTCLVNFDGGSLAADLVADMRFEVIGTHQLDAIWVFLVLQRLLAIFFGDAAGNRHLFAHGI